MFMTWIQDPDNIEMDPKHRLVDLKYLDKGSLSSLREGVDLSSGESSPELRYIIQCETNKLACCVQCPVKLKKKPLGNLKYLCRSLYLLYFPRNLFHQTSRHFVLLILILSSFLCFQIGRLYIIFRSQLGHTLIYLFSDTVANSTVFQRYLWIKFVLRQFGLGERTEELRLRDPHPPLLRVSGGPGDQVQTLLRLRGGNTQQSGEFYK